MELEKNEIQEYLHNMYISIVQGFLDIFDMREDEIKIIYEKDFYGTANYELILATREARIFIRYGFFDYSEKEQKGTMAHEIGHHVDYKDCNIPKLERKVKWAQMYDGRMKIPDSRPHWIQRIEKWIMLNEMAADNNAAKAGYGKERLELYKRISSEYNNFDEFGKKRLEKYYDAIQKLLTNLEQKLEVGK